MKILQIVKTSDGANWAFEQARALKDRGVEITTVLPNAEGSIAKRYIDAGLSVCYADLSLPVSKPWRLFSQMEKIRKIVKEQSADIIHCHFVTNILLARIALGNKGPKRLFQVPGPLHLESGVFRRLDIVTATRRDYWAGSCKKTCDIYKSGRVSSSRIFLNYYGGYGGERCNQYAKRGDRLHQEFDIPASEKTIGMVSYFYKPKRFLGQKYGLKGHEDFINAFELVSAKCPEARAIIIGGPWGNAEKYYEKVRAYAAERCGNRVIFTGVRHDVDEIYCELDVAVHPSHSENLGGAAESLGAGRPTISTDVGGFPDIVEDSVTGFLVPPYSPQALAGAMLRMLDDPEAAEAMAVRGQARVRKLLDIDRCANEMLDTYKAILKE